MKIHFDLECQDPDDVITLAILATHPDVDLVGLSLTPGGTDQVGLVREVLRRLGHKPIPIGADNTRTKPSVSGFHDKWIGEFSGTADMSPEDVLDLSAKLGATLLTGAPLKNMSRVPKFCRWVAQGGFAGDSIVPVEHRLAKFAGRETCPTFNFGGAWQNAQAMLSSDISEKILVSKNVCHGVLWDEAFHQKVRVLLEVKAHTLDDKI